MKIKISKEASQDIINSSLNINIIGSDRINYGAINLDEIPYPIYNYLDKKPDTPFIFSVKKLQNALIKFDAKSEIHTNYKNLYLLLSYYYLRQKPKFTELYELLNKTDFGKLHRKLLMYLKYDFFRLNKILLIVSVDYEMNNNYYSLKRYLNKNSRIKMFVEYAKIEKIFDLFADFDQVFFIGHGGDRYINVGNERIEEHHFRDYVNKNKRLPSVLGLFSCNHLIQDKNIYEKFDYYITDDEVSFASDVELFIFGYFRSYYKSNLIQEAYWAGRITPFLRTRGIPPFIIYERGDKI